MRRFTVLLLIDAVVLMSLVAVGVSFPAKCPRPGGHADRRPGRVPVGNPRRSGHPLGNPAHLAVAPDGSIWVADGDNDRFQIFAPDGSLLESVGRRPAPARGSSTSPRSAGAATTRGRSPSPRTARFYVADPGNHRIQKFGPDRRFLTAWGSEGTGARAVRHPHRPGRGRAGPGLRPRLLSQHRSRRAGDRRRAGLRRRRAVPRRVGRARLGTGAAERTVRDRARPRRHAPGRRVRQQPRAALHAGGRAPRRVGRVWHRRRGVRLAPWTRRWTPRGACS